MAVRPLPATDLPEPGIRPSRPSRADLPDLSDLSDLSDLLGQLGQLAKASHTASYSRVHHTTRADAAGNSGSALRSWSW